jgi:hypothetical protein
VKELTQLVQSRRVLPVATRVTSSPVSIGARGSWTRTRTPARSDSASHGVMFAGKSLATTSTSSPSRQSSPSTSSWRP